MIEDGVPWQTLRNQAPTTAIADDLTDGAE